MKKETFELIDLLLKTLAFISIITIAVIYTIVITKWSDADYCNRGVSVETTCK